VIGPGEAVGLKARVVRRGWKLVRKTFAEAVEDRITTSAAGMAFHWFLAIFPALVAAVAAVGLVGLTASQLRSLVHGLDVLLPVQISQTIDQALRNPARGTGGGVEVAVGLAVALWSATEAMAALQVGLDVAFEVSSDRGFVRRRLAAVPLLVLTVVLGGAASGLLVLGDPIRSLLPSWLSLARSTFDAAWVAIRWAGALALVVLLLSAYYSFGPNRKRSRMRWVSPGAVVAAVGWLAASAAFSFYLSHFGHQSRSYGAFAGVAALLLWLYLTAVAVMLGAELDCEIGRGAAVALPVASPPDQ
jgi:membrane protein